MVPVYKTAYLDGLFKFKPFNLLVNVSLNHILQLVEEFSFTMEAYMPYKLVSVFLINLFVNKFH